MVSPIISCGECYYCKMGCDQLCIAAGEGVKIPNIGQAKDGAFAEMIDVPISNIIKLPDSFDLELTSIKNSVNLIGGFRKLLTSNNKIVIKPSLLLNVPVEKAIKTYPL